MTFQWSNLISNASTSQCPGGLRFPLATQQQAFLLCVWAALWIYKWLPDEGDQSQADQPNSLADCPPMHVNLNQNLNQAKKKDCGNWHGAPEEASKIDKNSNSRYARHRDLESRLFLLFVHAAPFAWCIGPHLRKPPHCVTTRLIISFELERLCVISK